MRITVIANQAGKIIAAQAHENAPKATTPTGRIAPLFGQSIHEFEAPEELVESIHQGSFAENIFHYQVNNAGKKATLSRMS